MITYYRHVCLHLLWINDAEVNCVKSLLSQHRYILLHRSVWELFMLLVVATLPHYEFNNKKKADVHLKSLC